MASGVSLVGDIGKAAYLNIMLIYINMLIYVHKTNTADLKKA